MIIDAHTHIGFNTLCDTTAQELLASMTKAGIDKSFVFAGEMFDLPTERLIKEIAPYKEQLYAIGSISPLLPNIPSVGQVEDWLRQEQIHGIKFYTGYEHFYPADSSIRPYLELLLKYNRPAIFHSGDTYSEAGTAKLKYAQSIHIDDVATDMPELRIIIAHMGYPWIVDTAEVCYKNKNVFVDCSGFVYGTFSEDDEKQFEQMVREFIRISHAPDRILFGTDWAISDQVSYVRVAKSVFGDNNENIFFKNAIRLFGIT